MNSMYGKIVAIVAVIVAVLAASACGGDDSPTGPTVDPNTSMIDTVPPGGVGSTGPHGDFFEGAVPIYGEEAQALAGAYSGTNEAEGFVREVGLLGENGFTEELGEEELLAYGFELLLRENELIDLIMEAEDAEGSIEDASTAYIDSEVARLAEAGFSGPGVRDAILVIQDNMYRLRRLVDQQASPLDCPESERSYLHSDPAIDFEGFATPEEAAGHSGIPPGTYQYVLDSEFGGEQSWLVIDEEGAVFAEIRVMPFRDGWFPGEVESCGSVWD